MTAIAPASAPPRLTSAAAYRVRATRWLLATALVGTAFVRALAAGLALIATLAIVDAAVGVPAGIRRSAVPVAITLGVAALLATLWRGRGVWSLERVALWVEERIPWLHYALVTSIDPRFVAAHPALEPVVGEAQWGAMVIVAWWRAARLPLVIAAAAIVLLVLLPAGAASRVLAPRAGDSLARPAAGAASDPLAVIVATVTPPGYSGRAAYSIDAPSGISALVGSRITFRGRGPGGALRAVAGDETLVIRTHADDWSAALAMPTSPMAVRLSAAGRERLIVLEPVQDSPPVVRLGAPARDSVLRAPSASIPLAAEASDDIGLASGAFEVIVSSGQGENFDFRTLSIGARELGGNPRADLRGTLNLDSLALGGGDVLHIRAVARDANAVSGPGAGTSETRTIRIARPDEYDTVAVEGAPPPEADKSLLSQRMLIIAAERLHARRAGLARPEMLSESRRIAADQARLRQRVGEIVFIRLEGEDSGEHAHGPGDGHEHGPEDLAAMTPEQLVGAAEAATAHDASEPLDFAGGESPVVRINRPLLEAYNAMWQAGTELGQGDPGRALPHMRSALEALQRARAAERVYLRGQPPAVVVDIGSVRMSGTERGTPAAREAAATAADPAVVRSRRLAAALELLATAPAAATDSLILLRLDAIGVAPTLAAALQSAIDALRTGRDATKPLMRVRRAAAGEPLVRRTLPAWGSGW